MNGKDDDIDDVSDDEVSDDEELDGADLDDDDTDNVGDLSVELNVDELLVKLAESDEDDVHRRAEIRRRLEELRELREQELDSTFNFKFDDDD